MRLIDATALVRAILEVRNKIPLSEAGNMVRGGILKALHCIDTAPTVDAVTVVHGRWIELEPEIGLMECNLCGHKIIRATCSYCPNCGAKMISAPTENEKAVTSDVAN